MSGQKMMLLVTVLVLLAGAFFAGMYVGEERIPVLEKVTGLINKEGDALTVDVSADPVDFMPYWRVWNTLERKFIPFSTSTMASIAAEDKLYKSIEGLVASYNDPYTTFMRPERAEEFKILTKGSLEGIGSVVGEREGSLIIVGPLPGSPAESAGLVPGDRILSVDGMDTKDVSIDDAVSLIRGEGGTEVVLNIQSEGQEPRDVSIVRGTIEIPSTAHAVIEREVPKIALKPKDETPDTTPDGEVKGTKDVIEPVETEVRNFYILRLFSFSQTSINAFERELMSFVESGSKSLIIDLRGNPGGYLQAAVNMAGWFLPQGSVVVREFGGPEVEERVHKTVGHTLFKNDLPEMVILVDGGSASASEILAGALSEHGVATLIGTNTFGKGSVQELISITDELSLKVTVARWYTPEGVSISQGGLTPAIPIDTNATSGDPWIDAAIDHLAGTLDV